MPEAFDDFSAASSAPRGSNDSIAALGTQNSMSGSAACYVPKLYSPQQQPMLRMGRRSGAGAQRQILILRDMYVTISVTCRKELPATAEDVLTGSTDVHAFLDFVAAERLRSMPHKGSKWDKILKWAEAFARKIEVFAESVCLFLAHSLEAAQLVWGACRLLLQLGPECAGILEKAFGVFSQTGHTLDFFLRHVDQFHNVELRGILAHAYGELVRLAAGVAIQYGKKDAVFVATGSDYDGLFGRTVDSFFQQKDRFSDEAWAASLGDRQEESNMISVLRRWLSPQDRALSLLLSDRMGTRTARFEYTCEWFGTVLQDFQRSKEDVLVAFGKAGTGKTVIAGWVLEQLRSQDTPCDVIHFSVDANLVSQTTPSCILKDLLLDLVEINVGNAALYRLLCAVYQRAEQDGSRDLESALWLTFESALSQLPAQLVIVIDGLDQLHGGEKAALAFFERLRKNAERHPHVRCIIFSRPLRKPFLACPGVQQTAIEPKRTHDDLDRFVKYLVGRSAVLLNLEDQDRQKVVQRIVQGSDGAFLAAELLFKLIRHEKTLPGILKCLETPAKSVPDLSRALLSGLDFSHGDTKLILSWLLVSERPLTLLELKSLLETDTKHCTYSARLTNIEEDVLKACGPAIKVRDGFVFFAHHLVKEQLVEWASSGKLALDVKEAHKDLMTRCLAYLKLNLKSSDIELDVDCSLGSSENKTVRDAMQWQHLLEYAARYWVHHFRRSSLYDPYGKHGCTPELKTCFPETLQLAVVEGSWWESQTSTTFSVELHSLALSVRKSVLRQGDAVTQCLLNLARMREKHSDHQGASECFFEAWQNVKGKHSVALSCANAYMGCVESLSMEVALRTEVVARSEKIYEYRWQTLVETKGAAHKETITAGRQFVSLCMHLEKTDIAVKHIRQLRKSCVEAYGQFHEETVTITQQLCTVLEKVSRHEERVEVCQMSYELSETTLEVWDEKRISTTISMVEVHESQQRYEQAEEVLVSLQRKITHACKSKATDEVHEARIEVTIQYAKFLCRHSREKEAENILVELWTSIKVRFDTECHRGERSLACIQRLGMEMRSLTMTSSAKAVFSTLWSYYKSEKSTSSEAMSVAVELSTIHRSMSETVIEETILKEAYEVSTTTMTTTKTIETTTVKTVLRVTSFYEREERWSEAIDACSSLLIKLFPSVCRPQGTVCRLPVQHCDEAVELSYKLAVCYHKQSRIEEAEMVHLHVFRACLSSLQLHDEKILVAVQRLVAFYEATDMIEKAMRAYTDLYEEYRQILGSSHSITVRISYRLARLCEKHRPRDAERYYVDIIGAFGQGTEECDIRAINACLALCKHYEHDKRVKEAQSLYRRLWLTFGRSGTKCGMSSQTVITVYRRYAETVSKTDYAEYRGLAVKFREACTKHYGHQHELTIQATLELAHVLEQKETHREEAVSLYEELCKVSTEQHSALSETTFVEVKRRLAHLYESHASTTSVAEVMYYDSWTTVRQTHGCAHEQTISRLSELVLYFKRHRTQQSLHTAMQTLQSAVLEIIMKEKGATKLFHSGQALAKLYLALEAKDTGLELLREVRRQLTSAEEETSERFGFSLHTHTSTVDRTSFVFIMAFEEAAAGNTRPNLLAEIMNDIMAETTLSESWMRCLRYGGRFEHTLTVGARLRRFLHTKHRASEADTVRDELWEQFLAGVGEKAEKNGAVWALFVACVDQMADEEHRLTVLDVGVNAVLEMYAGQRFADALELAAWLDRYMHAHGSFSSQKTIAAGFKLALCLAGCGTQGSRKCTDKKVNEGLVKLSRGFLQDVLQASEREQVCFNEMSIEELDSIVGLLGAQENWKDLERILRNLWESRQTRTTWSADVVVSIGCRLCEVQFAHQNASAAIALCEDICYNLRRVWGIFDATTLRCFNLLSSFYTAAGTPNKSIGVHEDILLQLVADGRDALTDRSAGVAREQLRLLRCAYQRFGKWEKESKHYESLWERLVDLFAAEERMGEFGEPVTVWSAKTTNTLEGKWKAPREWKFVDASPGNARRHRYYHPQLGRKEMAVPLAVS